MSVLRSAPLNVLVVDDNFDAADSLVTVLRFAGYRASAVYNGWRALRVAAMEPPDVLLLDLAMPGLNGHEVIRSLKADPLLKDVPVVVVTGNATEEEQRKAFTGGCAAFLPKPLDFIRLGALLMSVSQAFNGK
jgi:two-component system, sensor histidine kinase